MIAAQKSMSAASAAYRRDAAERVENFMPLVRRLAWHMHGNGRASVEVEDLIQTGLVALTECIQRHHNECDDGFAAYVKMRVKGSMIDLLRRTATITRSAMQRRRELRDTEAKLQSDLGRTPSETELACAMNIDPVELASIKHEGTPLRFDGLDECYSDGDLAFADASPDSFELLCEEESQNLLADAVHGLGERHQLIIQLYFVEELNLAEIAQVLDVSVPRVHQLKAQALAALKQRLAPAQLMELGTS